MDHRNASPRPLTTRRTARRMPRSRKPSARAAARPFEAAAVRFSRAPASSTRRDAIRVPDASSHPMSESSCNAPSVWLLRASRTAVTVTPGGLNSTASRSAASGPPAFSLNASSCRCLEHIPPHGAGCRERVSSRCREQGCDVDALPLGRLDRPDDRHVSAGRPRREPRRPRRVQLPYRPEHVADDGAVRVGACPRRERAARRLNAHSVQLAPYSVQPTLEIDRPLPLRREPASLAQGGVDISPCRAQPLHAGRVRVQDRESSGGALVGERGCETAGDERLLGCTSEIAERRRVLPGIHRAGDRDTEQYGDRQEHQQHQLCADAQPCEQRRRPAECGRGHALLSAPVSGRTGGHEVRLRPAARPRRASP